ncbi:MAG: hypothetical protein ACREK4_10850, partial [Candidatus Rokuibacteriota bacterium]
TGERDRYTFTIAAPTRVVFDSLTNNFQLTWSLVGPAPGVVPITDAGLAANNLGFTEHQLFLAPGSYTVTVDATGDQTSAYSFRLVDLATAADITATLGTPVNGQLNPGNESDFYRFNANAGDQITFDAITTGVTMTWTLITPFGSALFGPSVFVDQGPITLGATGTYTLALHGALSNTSPGSYTFNVISQGNVPPPAPGTALTLGATTSGTIAVGGEVDRFTFTLATPGQLYLDSLTNSGTLQWTLVDPAGATIESRTFQSSDGNFFGGNAALRNMLPGTYELRVSGTSGTATGAYSFRLHNLLDAASSTAIVLPAAGTPATPISGTLTPGNETDIYRFTVAPGARIFFDTQTFGSVTWRLVSPLGAQLFGPTTVDVDTLTLSAGGTYILLIEGNITNTANINYAFAVQPVPLA